ncbi:MAG: chromosome partitioning protein ParB [Myxococcales bacterium]|nr:chromosome partitioning protein ParB [Myxococcales bacterium]|tara:strand:+ start:1441 stop:2313 length:873 start_codon:yes stop_codon:yes gene_type:complete
MTQSRRNVLGRGLSALIPEANDPVENSVQGITQLRLDQIQAADHQPRLEFDQARLIALSASIKSDGLLQPVVVRRVGQSTYSIIAGERRYRASKLAGLESIPVVIRDVTESEAFELALIENVQREDLNPIEEADAFSYLAKERQLSHEEIAARMGRDRVTITNALRLLKLPEGIRHMVATAQLSAGHGRAILMAPSTGRSQLAEQTIKGGWSVRRTEKEAKALKALLTSDSLKPVTASPAHRAVEDQLRAALGAPIKLVNKKGVGRIEIRFHSMDELERLLDLMASLEGQ